MLNVSLFLSYLSFFCWKIFVQIYTPFLLDYLGLLMSSFLSSLNILENSLLWDEEMAKIFSYSMGWPTDSEYPLLYRNFPVSSGPSHLLLILMSALFKHYLLFYVCSRIFPTFSSIKFSVSGFILKSMNHLGLSFVQGDRLISICIILHVNRPLYHHHLLMILAFIHCLILTSLLKIRCP